MNPIIDITTTQDQFAHRGVGVYTRKVVAGLIDATAMRPVNKPSDHYYLLKFDAESTLDGVIREYEDYVTVINLGKLRLSDKFNRVWWHRQFRPAISRLLKSTKNNERAVPSIYFCPYFWRGFPTHQKTAQGQLLPTVVMIHDLALPILGKYSNMPWYLDWIRHYQYHQTLRKTKHASAIITNSENTKLDYLKYVNFDPDQVYPIHLGLSDRFEPVDPNEIILKKYLPDSALKNGYILYYGGTEKNKNVVSLLRAYAELKNIWSKSTISIISEIELPPLVLLGGDFSQKKRDKGLLKNIDAAVENLGLLDDVIFAGYFETDDQVDLISSARLFVHLSLYEGFGFAALEPMKCGVPVVASNRSCYPEVLGDGAILVDPDESTEVAEAMFEILTDHNQANQIAQKGQDHASKYTWEQTVKATYKVFADVVRA